MQQARASGGWLGPAGKAGKPGCSVGRDGAGQGKGAIGEPLGVSGQLYRAQERPRVARHEAVVDLPVRDEPAGPVEVAADQLARGRPEGPQLPHGRTAVAEGMPASGVYAVVVTDHRGLAPKVCASRRAIPPYRLKT